MARTITQAVRFQGATPGTLFALFADARRHRAATGAPAKVSARAGARWSAWDGYCWGRNLAVVPKRLVVQSWRASDWAGDDPDSVLVLAFREVPGGAALDLVHANVPDDQAAALDEGWKENYWRPWKAHLKAKAR